MKLAGFYILKNCVPVEEYDLFRWGLFMEKGERLVAQTKIDGLSISTVFLGIDHSGGIEFPPLLFETMIFGLPIDVKLQKRYCTWKQAEEGHEAIVHNTRKKLKKG